MKPTKRTVLWIVPILIIGIFYYFYGPKDDITENEHIDYIKAQTLGEDSNLPVGEAFERYCSKSEWVYFETQKRQKVVEFKGECPGGKSAQPVNLQFLVDEEGDGFILGALLVDHVQQTEEERASYIRTVYEQAAK